MESANLHQHHHEDQSSSSSSSLAHNTSSSYGLLLPTPHMLPPTWTPNPSLNTNNSDYFLNQSTYNGSNISNDNHSRERNESSFIQEHHHINSLQWFPCNSIDEPGSFTNNHHTSFPKFTQMLLNNNFETDPSNHSDLLLNHPSQDSNLFKIINDQTKDDKLLKTISSAFPIDEKQYFPDGSDHQFHEAASRSSGSVLPMGRGNFSQIYPSVNISNLNRCSSSSPVHHDQILSNSFNMNLQGLDASLINSNGGLINKFSLHNHSNDDNDDDRDGCGGVGGLYKESSLPFGVGTLQHTNNRPSCNPNKLSKGLTNEPAEAKRPGCNMVEPKLSDAAAPKKSRVESRPSCPPFKVRKEKLGDRIASLQQLVAPFGKTDTASVLMEAIGYIKFLQNQVETLSVPYMKSSRNKTGRTAQGSFMGEEERTGDIKEGDLRSRGLCLVPLSCMTYVTTDNSCVGVGGGGSGGGGGIWPPLPPGYGGGT